MTDPSPDAHDTPADTADRTRRVPRWVIWTVAAIVGVVVLGYGAIFLYAEVLRDSPDELGEDDLAGALAIGTSDTTAPEASVDVGVSDPPADGTVATVAPTTPDTSSSTAPSTAPSAAPSTEPSTASGSEASTWTVTDASELGYRVKELLFGVDAEAVGRTDQITGALTIEGTAVTAAEFEVDVASIESDDGRRDNQFRGRIMSTDEFPTATFVLTEPIDLGTEAVEGAEVATTATGDLTLRGVTNPVTFDLTARLENGRIGVLGAIPIVFADYQIANPSIAGITTEDNGLLEFVLVFAPA